MSELIRTFGQVKQGTWFEYDQMAYLKIDAAHGLDVHDQVRIFEVTDPVKSVEI